MDCNLEKCIVYLRVHSLITSRSIDWKRPINWLEETDQLNTTDLSSHIVINLTSEKNDCFMGSVWAECTVFYSSARQIVRQFIDVILPLTHLKAPGSVWCNLVHSNGRWHAKSLCVITDRGTPQRFWEGTVIFFAILRKSSSQFACDKWIRVLDARFPMLATNTLNECN